MIVILKKKIFIKFLYFFKYTKYKTPNIELVVIIISGIAGPKMIKIGMRIISIDTL